MRVIITTKGMKFRERMLDMSQDRIPSLPLAKIVPREIRRPPEYSIVERSCVQFDSVPEITVKVPKINLSPPIKEKFLKYALARNSLPRQQKYDYSSLHTNEGPFNAKKRSASNGPAFARQLRQMSLVEGQSGVYIRSMDRYNYEMRQRRMVNELVKEKQERLEVEKYNTNNFVTFMRSFKRQSQSFIDNLKRTNGWKRKRERLQLIHNKNLDQWRSNRISNLAVPRRILARCPERQKDTSMGQQNHSCSLS